MRACSKFPVFLAYFSPPQEWKRGPKRGHFQLIPNPGKAEASSRELLELSEGLIMDWNYGII